MGKIGVIGYGHMGSVMLNSLLSVKAVAPKDIIISTRTSQKLDALKTAYPDIETAASNKEVAKRSNTLFLCVGTKDVKPVLTEILDVLNEETHLITISGGVEMASIEQLFHGKISKIMPTLISEVHEGVTLICHNTQVEPDKQEFLLKIFTKIGQVKLIEEHQFDICSNLTSCFPAFMASICHHFIQSGVKQSDLTYDEAVKMVLHTLYGTANLLLHNDDDFISFVNRVATKGGATEQGTRVLDQYLPNIFFELYQATTDLNEERKRATRSQFL